MISINKLERKIKNYIKKVVFSIGYEIIKTPIEVSSDKIVTKKIGKFNLLMREDHKLPIFLKHLPHYSKNLPRLAVALKNKYPELSMIDVGANIGDTVALVKSECNIPIHCIDGDEDFFELLEKNIKQFENVFVYKQLLGEKRATFNAELKKNIETARIQQNHSKAESQQISIEPLDTLIENHKAIGQSKLLKIDTDGYDMKIVRGALEYIKNTKPVIFLEYDPMFLTEQGEVGISTLLQLESLGYDDVLFYDNLGRLILSTSLTNHLMLKQLNNYIDPKLRVPFPYYDIAVFHCEDKDVAEKFIESEMNFFYSDTNYAK